MHYVYGIPISDYENYDNNNNNDNGPTPLDLLNGANKAADYNYHKFLNGYYLLRYSLNKIILYQIDLLFQKSRNISWHILQVLFHLYHNYLVYLTLDKY